MALDVRLVDEVEAVLVAQLVPALVVGVVGEAHRVEVVALHDLDVADHAPRVVLPRRSSCSWRFTPLIRTALPLMRSARSSHLHAAEAAPAAYRFNDLPARPAQRHNDRVQVGLFGRPAAGRRHGAFHLHDVPRLAIGLAYRLLQRRLEYRLCPVAEQLQLNVVVVSELLVAPDDDRGRGRSP